LVSRRGSASRELKNDIRLFRAARKPAATLDQSGLVPPSQGFGAASKVGPAFAFATARQARSVRPGQGQSRLVKVCLLPDVLRPGRTVLVAERLWKLARHIVPGMAQTQICPEGTMEIAMVQYVPNGFRRPFRTGYVRGLNQTLACLANIRGRFATMLNAGLGRYVQDAPSFA
jgi:hypothetical protein